MDLDIPAWATYSLVFVVAVFSATSQVEAVLRDVAGRWIYIETYLLLAIFLVLPLAVFWALDRVGAIHDSSLISAIIVAASYQAIIKGTSPTQNATVSTFFQPLLTWMGTVRDQLGAATERTNSAFSQVVTAAVGRDGTLLGPLEQWVLQQTLDIVTVRQRLQEFETRNPQPVGLPANALPVSEWNREKAKRLLTFVHPTFWVRIQFAQMKLTPWSFLCGALIPYRLLFWALPTSFLLLLFFLLLKWAGGSPLLAASAQSNTWFVTPENVALRYYRWRFLKPNNTDEDMRRTLDALACRLDAEIPLPPAAAFVSFNRIDWQPAWDGLDSNVPSRCAVYEHDHHASAQYSMLIASLLARDEINATQADNLLRVLISGRLGDKPTACKAIRLLPSTLRTRNVEVRSMIEKELKQSSGYLWPDIATANKLPSTDLAGQPDLVTLERAVLEWREFLSANCGTNKPVTQPIGDPGKPPVDSDHDGVPDDKDLCPNTPTGLQVDERGCIVPQKVVMRPIGFEFDSNKLTAEAQVALKGLAENLRAQATLTVSITGHTDSVGTEAYNLALSVRRAQAVKLFLIKEGIAADRIVANGKGMSEPVTTNDTEQGRATNRRVEFEFSRAP